MNTFKWFGRTFDSRIRKATVSGGILVSLIAPLAVMRGDGTKIASMAGFQDPTGTLRTSSATGSIDLTGPFFQSFGTNGRSCGTCHQPSDGMTVSAAHVQARFNQSKGLDPIFQPNDGANCDHDIDLSTLAGRSSASSLVRTRGLFRIHLALPPNRDFEVTSVSNPYGCNETDVISMYRRALPTTNLRFLSTLMIDGRESSTQTGTSPITPSSYPQSLLDDLAHQAVDATIIHAQGSGLTVAQQQAIVAFEMGLTTAQATDTIAGNLTSQNATGGPAPLTQQPFYIGVNDPVGLDPNNPVPLNFNTANFNIVDSWQDAGNESRAAIARGQSVFNNKKFIVSGVGGLNGATFSNGVTGPDEIVTGCAICHSTPNVGDHSVSLPINIGVADPPGGKNVLDTSYLPVITICQKPSLTTCVQTTDPGRAMISGKFADVGAFKGPILRGLAARAPYFHNGSAQTLMDVVNFYDSRFHIGFTAQEKSDLVAFLNAL